MAIAEQGRTGAAAGAVKDIKAGGHYVSPPNDSENGVVMAHAVQTILADPQDLYTLWRDVESIPLWQEFVVSVKSLGGNRSHWVMGDPEDADGKRVEFDSEIYEDLPGKRISWRSVTPPVEQSGTVTFQPAENGRGTEVLLVQSNKVPGGALGNAVAAVLKRSPRQIVIEDLRHFKQLAESGEIPTVEGQPHGPRGASGGFKRWMYGEGNPTPPGSSSEV